ncbi:thioredoxin domain-containing protein [Desulfotruncus alcoholivorax]|uniref:thioredoxin domain-containing protein n=1 Tax=Desulfotruncus alcoholivorax TaxID=265477 RepID=UPI0004026FF3|nr:thioredoxin domain-containing protein [Desulfotruncus alcoholivorax]
MERESFEDEEVAELLNQNFVAVKVDREERPDIDNIYMNVCQALTGQGGWPLTIIMTPEKKPFFAGTYFPKTSKWGRAGLVDILRQASQKWHEDRETVLEAAEKITQHIQHQPIGGFEGTIEDVIAKGYKYFRQAFDPEYGGFGAAPKFPTPHNLLFLIRYHQKTGAKPALGMAEKTLKSMYLGGINDHIGYGFSRYSTDRKWLVPHFEKMLYDNALLALAYLEAYQATGVTFYIRAAEQIFHYVLRDMTNPEGGFYSAEDADSEGVEGKFYLWQPSEVIKVLGEEKGNIFCRVYDITEEGNFEGYSIPNLIAGTIEEKAGELNVDETWLVEEMATCRERLFQQREKRTRPHRDDKILTAWNSLMIVALARGASVLNVPSYLDAANKALQFIMTHLVKSNGRLMARFRDGEAAHPAYLDDYAFLTWGLLELYQATLEPGYLSQAIKWAELTRDLFEDPSRGGYFFYGSDTELLIARPKEIYDGAIPSGNSVMTWNLLNLFAATNNDAYLKAVEKQIKAFIGTVAGHPGGYSFFLTALLFAAGTCAHLIDIISHQQETEMETLHLPFDDDSTNADDNQIHEVD